jgi:hypothetical protein
LEKYHSLSDPLVPISTSSPAASFGQPTTEIATIEKHLGINKKIAA